MKKLSTFLKAYLIYVFVLIALIIGVFFYTRQMMIKYERCLPDNYVKYLITEVNDKSVLGSYLNKNNFNNAIGDGNARKEDFYERVKSGEITIKAVKGNSTNEIKKYEVFVDDNPLALISISEKKSTSFLGLMNITDWKIEGCYIRVGDNLDQPINDLSLIVPDSFKVYVDDKLVDSQILSRVDFEEFKFIKEFVKVPYGLVYEFKDLTFEPKITVKNEMGEFVALTKKNDIIYANLDFGDSNEAKTFIDSKFDILNIAKTWSMFMTDDLQGNLHGLQTVIDNCLLFEGTDVYNRAKIWGEGYYINFMSIHTLKGFKNLDISNYVKYNEFLYSCDVYLEKELLIGAAKTLNIDVFNNRLFFGNINGRWYLVDMLSLSND